jgi:hypothetical protein
LDLEMCALYSGLGLPTALLSVNAAGIPPYQRHHSVRVLIPQCKFEILDAAGGKSRREIVRCLKRYIAREVYHVLVSAASPIEP